MLARAPSSRCEGRELAISLSAVRRVRRLTQLRCWVVPGRDSSSSASSVRRVPSLHSKVEFNLAAIPPHLCRDESHQKCSGHPGSGPSARWRRLCPSSLQGIKTFGLAALPRCQPQTAPEGTVSALISPESFDSALLWAVPAQAPERVCLTRPLSVFAGGREPKVSRPLSRQSPPVPPFQTLSGANAPLRSAPLVVWRLCPPATPSRQRLQTTNALKGPTLPHHQEMDRHHPPEGAVKGVKIYNKGAAAEPLRDAE